MEKLHNALEHARRRRDTEHPIISVDTPNGAEDKWLALEVFQPNKRHLKRNRLHAGLETSVARNAIDMLRTRLLARMRANGWKRVMVTSPTPNCGKSTLTLNLALALQRQSDLRVIAMDLDLHRAAMSRIMGMQPKADVSALLSGEVPPENQMQRIDINLAISANTKAMKKPADLLKLPATQARLDALTVAYAPDIILFDVPPVFASDDAIAIARFVDCAVIVGAAEKSSVSDFDLAERELAQYTKVAGVVLNKCRFPDKQSGYDYGY
jgi:Mrp family chromosome partitioning ATPase